MCFLGLADAQKGLDKKNEAVAKNVDQQNGDQISANTPETADETVCLESSVLSDATTVGDEIDTAAATSPETAVTAATTAEDDVITAEEQTATALQIENDILRQAEAEKLDIPAEIALVGNAKEAGNAADGMEWLEKMAIVDETSQDSQATLPFCDSPREGNTPRQNRVVPSALKKSSSTASATKSSSKKTKAGPRKTKSGA